LIKLISESLFLRGFTLISSIANSMFMIQTEEEKEAAEKIRLIKRI
jgi:hypothetical protein